MARLNRSQITSTRLTRSQINSARKLGYIFNRYTLEEAQACVISDYRKAWPYCDQFLVRAMEILNIPLTDPRLK